MSVSALKQWWRRQQFDPSLGGAFVNPFFLTRRALASAMRRLAHRVRGRVLDVGCGQKPYMGMFNVSAYVGVEIDTPQNRAKNRHADQFYDGRHLPFGDAEFDTVVCSQVLEHVFEPDEFLAELNRVLKGGGTLLLTVPFVWDEHEQPYDYARYSSFGLRHLLSKQGFEVAEHIKTLADSSALCQLGNAYLYKILWSRHRLLNVFVTTLLMAPLSLLGMVTARLLPGNVDLYLDNVIVARKPESLGGPRA